MTGVPEGWNYTSEFDGGETGCGDLIIDLHLHFRRLEPGAVVVVRAADPGAPVEMPAWCRVTGHNLMQAAHPFYLIGKRIT